MNKTYIVFDIGGSSVKYGFFDENYMLTESSSFKTPNTFELMISEFEKLITNRKDIIGISISAPGAVDSIRGVIGGASAVPYIHGPNIKQIFKEKFGFEIAIENDANCAGLSEIYFGSAKEYQNAVYYVIGSGVGGCIIIDKKVIRGANLFGGELGFMFMNGDMQIYSELASTRALMAKINSIYEYKDFTGIDAFNSEDSRIKELIEKFCMVHGVHMFNTQYMLDPEVIILGGGICKNKKFYEILNRCIDNIYERALGKIRPNVIVGRFGESANLYGALANLVMRGNDS